MQSYIRPRGGACSAPGHHGYPRTKGQSLNQGLEDHTCYRPDFVTVRPLRHERVPCRRTHRVRVVYAADCSPIFASKSWSRDHTAQMIRASLLAIAMVALL